MNGLRDLYSTDPKDPHQESKDEIAQKLNEEVQYKLQEGDKEINHESPGLQNVCLPLKWQGTPNSFQKEYEKHGGVHFKLPVEAIEKALGPQSKGKLKNVIIASFKVLDDRSTIPYDVGVKSSALCENMITGSKSGNVAHIIPGQMPHGRIVEVFVEPNLKMTEGMFHERRIVPSPSSDLHIPPKGGREGLVAYINVGTPMADEFLKLLDSNADVRKACEGFEDEIDRLRDGSQQLSEFYARGGEYRHIAEDKNKPFVEVPRNVGETLARVTESKFNTGKKEMEDLSAVTFTLHPVNAESFNYVNQHMDGVKEVERKSIMASPCSASMNVAMKIRYLDQE